MVWSEIAAAWHGLADAILEQWPEMSAERLSAVAGDRAAFAHYLAEAHDLTLSEATEAIEDWILRLKPVRTAA